MLVTHVAEMAALERSLVFRRNRGRDPRYRVSQATWPGSRTESKRCRLRRCRFLKTTKGHHVEPMPDLAPVRRRAGSWRLWTKTQNDTTLNPELLRLSKEASWAIKRPEKGSAYSALPCYTTKYPMSMPGATCRGCFQSHPVSGCSGHPYPPSSAPRHVFRGGVVFPSVSVDLWSF